MTTDTYPIPNNSKELIDDNKGKDSIRLAKHVTLWNGINITVGSIVGSGIFITPASCLRFGGSVGASLLIWFASGVFSMIGALSFAELGTTIPRSGGEYGYLEEAFGPFVAFLFLWVNVLIVRPVLIAIVAISFGKYACAPFINAVMGNDNGLGGGADDKYEFGDGSAAANEAYVSRLVAACGMCILILINSYSVKLATKIQDILTLAKLIALAAIIIIGFIKLGQGNVQSFVRPFENTNDIKMISLAFYSGLFSYGGWNFLNIVTGEMKNPNRDLLLSILIGIPIVAVIYVLTNVAYLAVLTPAEIKASSAVAFDFAARINYYLAWFMPLLAGLSAFGTANAVLFTSGRIFFVGAQNGHLPKFLSMINIHWITPMPSILALGLLSIFYFAGKDITTLINFMSFMFYSFTALCVVGLLYLRWKRPNMTRPIKLPIIVHVIFLLTSAFILITSLVSDYRDIGMGFGTLLLGIPVYFIFVKKMMHSAFFRAFDKVTEAAQKLFLVVAPTEEIEEIEGLDEYNESSEMKLALASLNPQNVTPTKL